MDDTAARLTQLICEQEGVQTPEELYSRLKEDIKRELYSELKDEIMAELGAMFKPGDGTVYVTVDMPMLTTGVAEVSGMIPCTSNEYSYAPSGLQYEPTPVDENGTPGLPAEFFFPNNDFEG